LLALVKIEVERISDEQNRSGHRIPPWLRVCAPRAFFPLAAGSQRHPGTLEEIMIRKAKAVWHGTGRDGKGNISTDSGVLAETPFSFRTRFENEKGTNPEELIAAAHAGCFTMALAFQLQTAGFTPTALETEAAVTLEPEGQGFRIRRSALTLHAVVPKLDEATFQRLAADAEKNCPVSKVLNAEITLDAKLA
jgi:osmotically inducible protein OsmC